MILSMRVLTVIFLIFSLAVVSCKNDVSDPPEELSQRLERTHFEYQFAEGDYIDTVFQEEYHQWLLDTLGVTLDEKLIYKKYRNRGHLKQHTGRETNGFAEVGTTTFHTIWYADNHESVHSVVTLAIGHPPALFNEGIAVAHQADYGLYPEFVPTWNGEDFHELSKEFKDSDMPSLADLIESRSFFEYDVMMTYPIAGSFTRYLIDTRGMDPIKEFISGSDFYQSGDTTRTRFQEVYGLSLDDAWIEWLMFLDQY